MVKCKDKCQKAKRFSKKFPQQLHNKQETGKFVAHNPTEFDGSDVQQYHIDTFANQ